MTRKSKPREYTSEEIREIFIKDMWSRLEVCLNDERMVTPQHKLEVFMHSTLAMLDGAAENLPMFALVPIPHPEDKAWDIEHGKNYFPENNEDAMNGVPIYLHDNMYKYKPETLPER